MTDGRSPSGRAGRPTDQAAARLGDTATIPNAVLVARLRQMATEIDEDWAADIQEGGNSPRPVNTPWEAAEQIQRLTEVVRQIASYEWPEIVGQHGVTHYGEATGREYTVKHNVPRETAMQALQSVKAIAQAALRGEG